MSDGVKNWLTLTALLLGVLSAVPLAVFIYELIAADDQEEAL